MADFQPVPVLRHFSGGDDAFISWGSAIGGGGAHHLLPPPQAKNAKKKKDDEDGIQKLGKDKVEEMLATLEAAAEEDALLNRQSKPAVKKLKNLGLLSQILINKQLQPDFLDHGVLLVLKGWLQPLPDGSQPNVRVRTAVLTLLNDLPIGPGRREQLRASGIGNAVQFMSAYDGETVANRKSAMALIERWGRLMWGTWRSTDDERLVYYAPQSPKLPAPPKAVKTKDQQRVSINKKLHRMKCSRKIPLQITKLSAQGRGLVF